jgi:hypothetical protein
LIFWYCHKRGREVRLQKEDDLTEQEVARLDAEYRADHPEELQPSTAAKESDQKDIEADPTPDAAPQEEVGEKSAPETQSGLKSDVAAGDSKP